MFREMSSINFINIKSSAVSSYKGEELSNVTKLRLEALGIDPAVINNESQAKLIIAQLEGAQKKNGYTEQKQGGTEQELLSDAKNLAEQVGVSVSERDSSEDILNNIIKTLNTMSKDPAKAEFVQDIQDKLIIIAQRVNKIENTQQNIFNEMNMVSISNRLILGL